MTQTINTNHFFNEAFSDLKIDNDRKQLLRSIALFITNELTDNKLVSLNYICTHNSRRSQLSQVWSDFAVNYFDIKSVKSFSGGTSITAFYRNTIKTLQEVGFNFKIKEFSHQNPIYEISYENCKKSIIGFSKLYNDNFNASPFIAITTCSNADTNCPFIPEAIQRFHLPFVDPKSYDSTIYQSEKYLETNKQIAGELHFIFKLVKTLI